MDSEKHLAMSLRPSHEDVWLAAYAAAITGLCSGVDADDIVLPRGPKDLPGQTIGDVKDAEERGKQRRRKVIGAAALLANRAVQEWSLHWPEEPPEFEVMQCSRSDPHEAHVWMAGGGRGELRCPGKRP